MQRQGIEDIKGKLGKASRSRIAGGFAVCGFRAALARFVDFAYGTD
jgi:hypothetical protein